MAAGLEINASVIYAELGNFAIAKQKLTRAIVRLNSENRHDLLALAYLDLFYQQIRLGEIQSGIRSADQCIKIAHRAQLAELEAEAWDFRGSALLKVDHVKEAEDCLNTAVRLYQVNGKGKIAALTLEHLAELKSRQGQNAAALNYINEAFKNADALFKISPLFYPLTVRANILRDLGRADDALNAYREAIRSADHWRRAALPGDSTNIETVRELNGTYQAFAELAASKSLKTQDQALAREALETLAWNRAAGLGEQLTIGMSHNHALPPEYLTKLGQLQSLQARVTLGRSPATDSQLADLEAEISEIETKIGLPLEKKEQLSEKTSARNSLRNIQSGLGASEALFSFCLGERESFLWAVTNDSMNLYRLPPAEEIGRQAEGLRSALEHRQNFTGFAQALGRDLFSQLDSRFEEKADWLIVGDGALLDRVPFSALPALLSNRATLAESHTIRFLPGELFVLTRTTLDRTSARFLGIADPVYNLADSRRLPQPVLRNANNAKESNALGRLPGSQHEIRAAARASGAVQSDILVGPNATLARFYAAISHRPAAIHLAVHVVSPPRHPEQAALALSLGPDNIPELLTRETIATLRVPGSLVVLSGCSSGQGETVPSAGLVGLGRAWLLAGAGAVLVSNWPTPDDSGQFFTSFYSHLADAGAGSLAQRAARALQQAQFDMRRRGGYTSTPAFWAAYSIVAKE